MARKGYANASRQQGYSAAAAFGSIGI